MCFRLLIFEWVRAFQSKRWFYFSPLTVLKNAQIYSNRPAVVVKTQITVLSLLTRMNDAEEVTRATSSEGCSEERESINNKVGSGNGESQLNKCNLNSVCVCDRIKIIKVFTFCNFLLSSLIIPFIVIIFLILRTFKCYRSDFLFFFSALRVTTFSSSPVHFVTLARDHLEWSSSHTWIHLFIER